MSAGGAECSAVVENRSNCTSTLWTFDDKADGAAKADMAAQSAFSPASVRVAPSHTVTIVVHKRPLEKVQIQATYNQVAKPEVLGTLLGQLAKPLGGLTLGSGLAGEVAAVKAATAAANPANARGFVQQPKATPADKRKLDERVKFDSALEALGKRQDADKSALDTAKSVLNDLITEVTAAQKYPPVIKDEQWNGTDKTLFNECIEHILARIQGNPPKPQSPGGCKEPSKPAVRDTPVMVPDDELALLKAGIADLPKSLTALEVDVKGSPAEITPDDHENYLALIAKLTVRETKLDDELKTVQTTRDTLDGYKDPLTAWQAKEAKDANRMVVVSKAIKAYDAPAKSGEQTASIKVTAVTLLSKESSDVGTVAVTFTHQPWEVSGGIMYSTVLGRSFQNSPVISAGVPELDKSGKQITAVTDATTKPTVDALVLVHWRFYEWQPDSWTRRLAVLGSVGVGTGTNGSGADFAAGASLAYGSFFLSPLLHFTRDQRLTNGVTLGQNLMGTTPPTERYWVHKFGLALTYAVPIN